VPFVPGICLNQFQHESFDAKHMHESAAFHIQPSSFFFGRIFACRDFGIKTSR
jgi:hypothetical protein